MEKLRTMPATVWAVPLLFFLFAGCGDNGDNDTIFTGFSGVVLIIIAILVVRHFVKKNRGD
ncbi:MAG TPA: hypothetical protein VFI41_04740 [Gemmatimonadales bacterium]|nr:hypothetical protein [Gemmatimonadales bacterium]